MSDRIYLIEKRRKEAHTCHFGNDDTIDEIDRKRAAWSRYHHSLQAAYEAGALVPSNAAATLAVFPDKSPLHHLAKRGEQRTICEECGESELAHDRAVWTDDGSSFCPGCARRATAPALKVTLQDAARVLLEAWKAGEISPGAMMLDAGRTDTQADTISHGLEHVLRALSRGEKG
ncbi:hypothetical protein [Salipiger thiooxidans]|uniref:hypothetical protein n=1 Tax=Salipiger thiooxidans TaxID=282683 RepID=UPI001CFAEE19|nr:hypothetical protein [Salipiger thiooxidans]